MARQERIETSYTVHPTAEELPLDERDLVVRAAQAALAAYAPYSRFKVGAALRMENGTVVIGSNQENASYPAGICAERTALHAAMANAPGGRVVAIAVCAPPMRNGLPTTPCGICRQALDEQRRRQNSPVRVLLSSGPAAPVLVFDDISALLPLAFDPTSLGS